MNILYRACASKQNYQLNILEALRERKIFDKCTVISQTLDHGDNYPAEYYHEIKAWCAYQSSYNAICDYDELPAIPKSILSAMLPYKTTILDMTCRVYHMHIMTYEEMDMFYIKHLRFWNYILDRDQIGFCFFSTVPHTAWEYTIYALAKIKKIPTLLIEEHWITELCSVATDIAVQGSSAAACYNNYETIGMDDVAQAYYDKLFQDHIMYTKKDKKEALKIAEQWRKQTFYKPIFKTIMKLPKMKKRYKNKEPYITVRSIWNCRADIKYIIRQRIFERCFKGVTYYDQKIAGPIDLEQKYILFSLQYTPEASTLPNAGVFSNQLLTIQLLAEAAKARGIKVYVKEHWSQWKRMTEFYHELSVIPNVCLVRTDIENNVLMEHAYMVASQTGTCILEAFLQGIPCLIFANNACANAPGVFYVNTKEEIIEAIDMAEHNHSSLEDGKKYFAAICKTSVRSSLDWKTDRKYTIQECTSDLIELITDYVAKGMPEDYYYENHNLGIQ